MMFSGVILKKCLARFSCSVRFVECVFYLHQSALTYGFHFRSNSTICRADLCSVTWERLTANREPSWLKMEEVINSQIAGQQLQRVPRFIRFLSSLFLVFECAESTTATMANWFCWLYAMFVYSRVISGLEGPYSGRLWICCVWWAAVAKWLRVFALRTL